MAVWLPAFFYVMLVMPDEIKSNRRPPPFGKRMDGDHP